METAAPGEAEGTLSAWAERLALEVAPDEVDVAAAMAEAFAEGGRARGELFARAQPLPGGFGVGDVVAVIPWVLKAITLGAPLLLSLLASTKLITDFLECVKGMISLLEAKHRGEQPKEASPPGALSEPSVPLRRVLETLEQQLRGAGLSEERVEHLSLGTLKVLLEDPPGASDFVREVSRER